jgi:hypothetical protein
MTGSQRETGTWDWAIALTLFAGTLLYLWILPHSLGGADESFFLYEAKRIRDGEVMYRDFFQFVAPLAWYVMAALYWLFGTDMATARIAMGAVHGVTAAISYLACRRIGVRRELALIVPLAYVAICQPVWPYASPHWFSTCLIVVLLWLALSPAALPSVSDGRRRALRLGIVGGLLICVQQQKGAVLAAGLAILVFADYLLAAPRPSFSLRRAVERLAFLAGGTLLVVGPVFAVTIAAAGWEPVYRDVVLFPLQEYRPSTNWSSVSFLSVAFVAYTWPKLLSYLPVVLVVPFARAAWQLLRRDPHEQLRALMTLVVLGGFSVLSILYYADFIHLAFVAPVLLVAAAESSEWLLRHLGAGAPARATGWVLAGLLAVSLGRQLYDNTTRQWATFPVSHQTAFGRVDFTVAWEAQFVDTLRGLLDKTPSRELFCYPFLASPYLTAAGRNPTPYQHLAPSQSPRQQIDEATAILKAHPPPYIVAAPMLLTPGDPIGQLINDAYEFIPIPGTSMPSIWIYGRPGGSTLE